LKKAIGNWQWAIGRKRRHPSDREDAATSPRGAGRSKRGREREEGQEKEEGERREKKPRVGGNDAGPVQGMISEDHPHPLGLTQSIHFNMEKNTRIDREDRCVCWDCAGWGD
jgi:hypothetical protein